jgi:hypothetical protein
MLLITTLLQLLFLELKMEKEMLELIVLEPRVILAIET